MYHINPQTLIFVIKYLIWKKLIHNNIIGKVSVIITIFNNSEFLTKSINSVLRQSYSPKEIILIDDDFGYNAKKIYLKFKNKKN